MTDTIEAPEEAVEATSKPKAKRRAAAEVPNPAPLAAVEALNGANVGTDDDDVLDLTQFVPSRKLVRLPTTEHPKGEVFSLRLLDDFGIVDQQRLLSWSRRFEALWNKEAGDLTKDEQIQLKHLLDQMFITVLDAPDEIKKQTPDHIKSRVVTSFTLVPLLERQKREEEEAEERAKEAQESESPSTSGS